MPGSSDPEVYIERAKRWSDAAAALPPGQIKDVYVEISEGYLRLAEVIKQGQARAIESME
jgi:hypothetical protein